MVLLFAQLGKRLIVSSVFLVSTVASGTICDAQFGLKLPVGFVVEQVANDEMATNIYCLNVSPQGSVYVSGPGYIKRLVDQNGDGVFDESRVFSETPLSGAQGLWIGSDFLLCTGDDGLWKYEDTNHDGIADGPPERLLELTTGTEHSSHAIRMGPDGWFYVLCGNATEISDEFSSSPFSPVKNPRAGFLLRLSPDFRHKEVLAHGFRNAYDFDFNTSGEIFVYDSDGERDISLPWYRPTRVFKIQPGDDAGWISKGWKRPSSFFDMPTEMGALGRGSPTGVECYRGSTFPEAYADSLFVADWTFGRVVVFKRDDQTGDYDREEDFVVAEGQFGFAVTDLAVASNGSLLVSVGGRGTAGAVYRISYTGSEKLIQTESNSMEFARLTKPHTTRGSWTQEETVAVLRALESPLPENSVAALESLVGRVDSIAFEDEEIRSLFAAGIRKNLKTFDRVKAKLILRALQRENEPSLSDAIDRESLPDASRLLLDLASANSDDLRERLLMAVAVNLNQNSEDRLEICRIGQLALGGCGDSRSAEMFNGYTASRPLDAAKDPNSFLAPQLADAIRKAANQNDPKVAREIGRLAAMIGMYSEDLRGVILEQVEITESPIERIHWLNCLARIGGVMSPDDTSELAEVLVHVHQHILDQSLQTDRNWVPRMRELVGQIFLEDRRVASDVAERMQGRDSEVYLFDELPQALKSKARNCFMNAVKNDIQNATPNQLRIVAPIKSVESVEILRKAVKYEHLRETALLAICLNADPQDRQLMVLAVGSGQPTLVKQAAIAIRRQALKLAGRELLAVLRAASQMAWTNQDVSVRDQLVLLLQQQTGELFDYQFKQNGLNQSIVLRSWEEFLKTNYPDEYAEVWPSEDRHDWEQRLNQVDWAQGDRDRGRQIYQRLKCAQCHDGGSGLGPRLEGVTRRFGREDLFRTLFLPSDQVPDRYRAILIETTDGRFFQGSVIYESVDGITLQDVNGVTVRINQDDIESKQKSRKSLMPEGLLNDVSGKDLADLYSFIQSL